MSGFAPQPTAATTDNKTAPRFAFRKLLVLNRIRLSLIVDSIDHLERRAARTFTDEARTGDDLFSVTISRRHCLAPRVPAPVDLPHSRPCAAFQAGHSISSAVATAWLMEDCMKQWVYCSMVACLGMACGSTRGQSEQSCGAAGTTQGSEASAGHAEGGASAGAGGTS